MSLEIFGVKLKLVESTSPVPGRRCASVLTGDGSVWADLFVFDPLSGILEFDEARLKSLLIGAKRTQTPWMSWVLSICNGVRSAAGAFSRATDGSYGGTFGYGQAGSLVAMTSAWFRIFLVAAIFIFTIPFTLVGGFVAMLMEPQIKRERERALDQVIGFFRGQGG